jgi:hypothetical protein
MRDCFGFGVSRLGVDVEATDVVFSVVDVAVDVVFTKLMSLLPEVFLGPTSRHDASLQRLHSRMRRRRVRRALPHARELLRRLAP